MAGAVMEKVTEAFGQEQPALSSKRRKNKMGTDGRAKLCVESRCTRQKTLE